MYQSIIIEPENTSSARMATVLRKTDGFELAASYREMSAALGQCAIFRPNLFLVDAEMAENRRMLPALRDLFPQADIIGILARWNADYAQEAVQGGAMGCLLLPFDGKDLMDALAVFRRGRRETKPRMLAFFSAKGRSGKTSLIAHLAMEIARQSGELVGIVDADLQFSDMPLFFDVDPTTTVVEATRDCRFLTPLKLNPYFLPVAENVQLLCGPKRIEHSELVDTDSLTAVVRMAQTLFHYVLVDLPSGFSPFAVGMCEFADTTILTGMVNTGFEVRHMRRSMGMFQMWEQYGKNIEVVFSRVNPCTAQQKGKIEAELGHAVTAVLPNEYLMVSAANAGRIGQGIPSDSLMGEKIAGLAAHIIAASERWR